MGAWWPGSVPPSVQDWLWGMQVGLDGFVQPWCGEPHLSCLNRHVGLRVFESELGIAAGSSETKRREMLMFARL